ncbi:LacI family transcriptional regulator [Microbacterium terrae]|uniref:Catabolite control protein A n=1 Tax=Microbacterium terrae TaxID=69369 RepID=A0A0M2HJI7_9MICO|nr:LacI family DNA-binding transcriptional regulator [Microbacterium terrae]KJL44499.1 Catabolite control protein A [Microbacterium terrae]MBP1079498.1 LacI family transcriptional regulator [Microbacterium terrae]GLJ96839.1 transcriptional regulator [Microbacterium terrae]
MPMTSAAERRPTIMEVARLAGVSHQTVSRYLRFDGAGLKPQTRERVADAIAKLNYRPNLVARSMRSRVTGRVAVVMPSLAFNPTRMLSGATRAAHEAGYQVEVISPEGGAAARSTRILELADARLVDGILSFSTVDEAANNLPKGTVLVVSPEFDDEMRGIGDLADAAPVAEMIERLAESGHHRFLHIAGDRTFASARARATVFTETIARLGLASVGIFDGDWSGESGIAAVEAIRSSDRPTAIIAANDLVATGVLRAAHQRGWSVPDDLSVTGWDDAPGSEYLIPALTTVNTKIEQIGSNAMARLIGRLRDEAPVLSTEPINRVIWRESTGVAPTA